MAWRVRQEGWGARTVPQGEKAQQGLRPRQAAVRPALGGEGVVPAAPRRGRDGVPEGGLRLFHRRLQGQRATPRHRARRNSVNWLFQAEALKHRHTF